MHATKVLEEAGRLMTVCNSCRYCEGVCAVFPAMELRKSFTDGDLNYLANLCHNCGACYDDCQYSPPHEFDVNVPAALAAVRVESYAAAAWPSALSGMFHRNGLAISIAAALSVTVFVAGFVGLTDRHALFAKHSGPGAFYELLPHDAMAAIFCAAFLYAAVACALSAKRFVASFGALRRDMTDPVAHARATLASGSLRYLDGGGGGCADDGAHRVNLRKVFHHMTFYGFALCFLATAVATVYHYAFGREAPYAVDDLPVLLGTLGGIGLIVGPIGLLVAKRLRDPAVVSKASYGMDVAFIVMLLLTGATGMILLAARDTAAMGALLALHLGVVFGLMITMPYGKFIHGLFRYLALARYERERIVVANGAFSAVDDPPSAAATLGS
ncbi:tricarballylate utilization 4Fe-4S protein TcuB [Bradyrhizobium sp. LTSP885]|uniref:tricarballylate utilization 4Fe-4S protein TcuB n=1 Tax=Bradyrhizobium sp. LTSP885 TaxID=1619232 RepID=UPI0005C8DA87|nr:tricarballylate utilization 4Fe-4S protein TcuB [Bradyrhizobium sp. LTSP885]